jgi:hypothetical protein
MIVSYLIFLLFLPLMAIRGYYEKGEKSTTDI